MARWPWCFCLFTEWCLIISKCWLIPIPNWELRVWVRSMEVEYPSPWRYRVGTRVGGQGGEGDWDSSVWEWWLSLAPQTCRWGRDSGESWRGLKWHIGIFHFFGGEKGEAWINPQSLLQENCFFFLELKCSSSPGPWVWWLDRNFYVSNVNFC